METNTHDDSTNEVMHSLGAAWTDDVYPTRTQQRALHRLRRHLASHADTHVTRVLHHFEVKQLIRNGLLSVAVETLCPDLPQGNALRCTLTGESWFFFITKKGRVTAKSYPSWAKPEKGKVRGGITFD